MRLTLVALWLFIGLPLHAQDGPASPPVPSPSGEVLISGVVPDAQPALCIQQVGDYDQAYVDGNPALQFQLNVTCAERGYTEYDRPATEAMFDEPDKPGNGAYRQSAAPAP